ncbi:aldehyde dehydrogenase [Romboutsia sp.]|uniref:aldehyde dehydrogenase n=1 Tax=Romboutsia sp. TaxID=1965302 RepID=UPI002D0AA182|nr:aldehyde dehydrogenase [Romboutsia sp.]HSQ89090.1 aldehyde dehydrogenase [Romboutsia sp.]
MVNLNNYEEILNSQKKYKLQLGNISIKDRIEALQNLKNTIKKYENEIINALYEDLGKSQFEAFTTEVGFIYRSINYAIKNIKKWNKIKKVKNDVAQLPGKSYIYNSSYGCVLIIGPYNYPFQLSIEPLIGAIAGGNTAVIKPSEFTPNVEGILVKIIKETFDKNYVDIITGDYKVNSELLDLPFDYIFFTGSVNVGKIVMEKASKHLTPVTLELGGKSPVIVDNTAKLDVAIKRIVWGKFSNAGQTCVAPDYILVHEDIYDKFLEKSKNVVKEFYTENVKVNNDYGKIVNDRHMKRLSNILQKDSSKIVFGGEIDTQNRYISPTILGNVTYVDEVMKDEIFGPIMPVIKYKDMKDIEFYLNKYEKPLALYIFSENKNFSEKIINNITFGGGCINDTISHVASVYLPFGGVGKSGIGRYHGYSSFKTFTYEKSIVKKSSKIDIKLVFPPYNKKVNLMKKIMK